MAALNIKCNICGSNAFETVYRIDRLDGSLVKCRSCSLFYVNPRYENFTMDSLNADQRSEASARLHKKCEKLKLFNPEVEAKEALVNEIAIRNRLKSLLKIKRRGRLLDIGCGEGEFLSAASKFYKVSGIEPHPARSNTARSRGFEIATGTLFDISYPSESFDIVTLIHVIEHCSSPRDNLQEVFRILKPEGIVMLETPNIDSPWHRMLRNKWNLLTPAHYYFFSPVTISQLLKISGFTLLSIKPVEKYVTLMVMVEKLRQVGKNRLYNFALSAMKRLKLEDIIFKSPASDSLLVIGCKDRHI